MCVFHRRSGQAQWAKARLVRYADDFVIMAKALGRIRAWVERTVEGWLGLTINREKTRIVRLTPEQRTRVSTFSATRFGMSWDRYGRGHALFHGGALGQGGHSDEGRQCGQLINSRHNGIEPDAAC